MSTDFRNTIESLWNSLGLPTPVFDARGASVLGVDGLDIALSPADDHRHVVVSAEAGRLSANPVTRAEQVRRILEANLRDIAGNRACVGLDPSDPHAPMVVVRGIAACDPNKLDHLAAIINDVSRSTEVHERELIGHSHLSPKRTTMMNTPPEGMLIFGP